jgi:hypothetical protein
MSGTEILTLVTGAYDVVKSVGLRVIDLFAMGKVDETEALKLKAEYEKAVLNLDFQLKQAGLWMQEKLIAMEQATGAKWRTPLILVNGVALILAALNNILAACYFSWAHPVDMASPAMCILGGMFVLLVTGDVALLIKAFNANKNKDAGHPSSTNKKE